MLYELRVYEAMPGKLPALNNRFATFTLDAFKNHGFRVIGFWQPVMGGFSDQLIYMLAWESYEERQRCFSAFGSDPERQKVFAESEKDGPLVQRISTQLLQPTAYSPMQ